MPDVMSICAKLDASQRQAIEENFCKMNPRWRGAAAEDILDALDNQDSDLGPVEDAWDQYPNLHGSGFGVAVRALLWCHTEVNETNLAKLLKD